jgi:hypothetical protein
LRILVWQTNLGKEANLSRNPEREGPNFTRLLRQYLLFYKYFTKNTFSSSFVVSFSTRMVGW